jgi:hypothetical protein
MTQYGPQHVQFGFSRAPIRRVGAVPHTLTTVYSAAAIMFYGYFFLFLSYFFFYFFFYTLL